MKKSALTIVLIHGAFANSASWARVIPLLSVHGLKSLAVHSPLSSLADDAAAATRAIEAQEGNVLLVGHSWGGAVITEAGDHARVTGLVYVAAGAPDDAQSFQDWWNDYPPAAGAPEIKPFGKDYLVLTQNGVRKHFAQDLPAAEADVLWATQGPLAARCFGDKISRAAWRDKPTWYVVAGNDEMIPPAVECDSAKRMSATTLSLPSSHVPMLSRPQAVADFIMQAAHSLGT